MNLLAQHRRGERPKAFAELDFQIHGRLHLGVARVAEDAASAQRPRAEFHAAAEPADDLAVGEQVHGAANQLRLIGTSVKGEFRIAEDLLDLGG